MTVSTAVSIRQASAHHGVADGLIACHECDALHNLKPLPDGASAHCRRCDARLYRQLPKDALNQSLALQLTVLLLLIMACSFPFMSLKLGGRVETDMLLSGPVALFEMGMDGMGALILLTSVVFPLLTTVAALYLLVAERFAMQLRGKGALFRLVERLMPWSMLGVFMLGVLISIVKLMDLAEIEAGVSLAAFALLLPVSVMAQQRWDSSLFWPHQSAEVQAIKRSGRATAHGLSHCHTCSLLVDQSIAQRCPRCDDYLHGRKPDSLTRTWALLIAATLMLIPANVLPIMTVIQFGQGEPSTILSGVIHLIAAGMWPLGLIVFFASIMVPVSKLIALVYLLLSVQRQSTWKPDERTRLYRVTELIGSWSMVDIFIIGILTSLVSLDAISTIRPGDAANYFAAMVVLTMFAAQSFDPRLIWDAAEADSNDDRGNNDAVAEQQKLEVVGQVHGG